MYSHGFDVRNMTHPWAAMPRDSEDQLHIGGIDLLVPRNADGPAKATCAQRLPERSGRPVTGITQHTAKAHSGSHDTVDLLDRDLWLRPVFLVVELTRDGVEIGLTVAPQIGALGQILSQQAVGVLVRAALPRALAITEEDRDIGGQREPSMISQGPSPPTSSSAWFHKVASSRALSYSTRPMR